MEGNLICRCTSIFLDIPEAKVSWPKVQTLQASYSLGWTVSPDPILDISVV